MTTPREEELIEYLSSIRLENNLGERDITLLEPPGDPDPIQAEDERSRLDTEDVDEDDHEPARVPDPEPSLSLRTVFSHSKVHPLILDLILFNRYGVEWLTWEAETLWSEIIDDFKQTSISALCKAKIQALRTCHLVETPWKAWEVFLAVSHPFNNNLTDFQTTIPPTPAQLCVTVDTLSRINSQQTYSEEVQRFISACFLQDNVWYLPPPVSFAQQYASQPRYLCRECGRIDIDDENNQCDSCGAPANQLKRVVTWNPHPVKKRYDMMANVSEERRGHLEETLIDTQVAKLIVARDYRLTKIEQLRNQAEALHVQLSR